MVLEQSVTRNKEHGTLGTEGEEGKNDSSSTPSVTTAGSEEDGRRRGAPYSSLWKKAVDVEEAKNQLLLSLPLMLTNVSYFAIPLISVMFAGHLGDLELASSNLANSWANVSGFCFVVRFSLESLNHLLTNLKLALPSAAMVCLEFWAFELMVLLAGVMPNPEITTPLMAMCLSTETNAYMLLYGLSAAVSTRVSNELGAGNPDKAKHAMIVTLQLSILFGLIIIGALGIGRTIWAGLFSDNPIIIRKFTSMTPLLLTAMTIDTVQGILGGVARGCGWQKVVVFINLPMFYLIGVPLAVVLAFKFKLYVKGIYVGLICGISCQTLCLLWFTCLKKWTRVELAGNKNAEDLVSGNTEATNTEAFTSQETYLITGTAEQVRITSNTCYSSEVQ